MKKIKIVDVQGMNRKTKKGGIYSEIIKQYGELLEPIEVGEKMVIKIKNKILKTSIVQSKIEREQRIEVITFNSIYILDI